MSAKFIISLQEINKIVKNLEININRVAARVICLTKHSIRLIKCGKIVAKHVMFPMKFVTSRRNIYLLQREASQEAGYKVV